MKSAFITLLITLCIFSFPVYSQTTKQKKDKNKTAIVKQNTVVAKDTTTFVDKHGNKILGNNKNKIAKRINKKK